MRFALALVAAIVLAACQPGVKIDKNDPFASLYPWDPKAKGVQTLDSGVQYIVITKGDGKGPFPAELDQVEVNYDGRLAANGEKFDSSYDRGETATFPLNSVIPGWTEGLQKMQPGDEFMFFIPSAMGYGERGAGDRIPANSDLMFRVALINVIPATLSDPEAWAKVTPWPTDSAEVVRTAAGLEYIPVKSSDSDVPPLTDRDYAFVHFEGRLDDGTVIGSTFADQQPARFPVADLVPGWAETLKLMKPGDRWMVRMPASLMYADEGDGLIPPGAAVTFEIVLEDVIRIDPPAETATPITPPPAAPQ
jgi:peptidylprolyl isomerase